MARRTRSRSSSGTSIPVVADTGTLCLSCGLCCDGTVFERLHLRDDELPLAEDLGLVVGRAGTLGAEQPCPVFVDGCCSRYEERPSTCAGYRCGLLSGLASGAIERHDCLAVVGLVRSLAADLERAMGVARGRFSRRAARSYIKEHDPSDDPVAHAEFLVPFARLAVLGRKYFGYPIDVLEQTAVEAGESVGSSTSPAGST